MIRTSRLLAVGAFLLGVLLGASVCGASSSGPLTTDSVASLPPADGG